MIVALMAAAYGDARFYDKLMVAMNKGEQVKPGTLLDQRGEPARERERLELARLINEFPGEEDEKEIA